MMELRLRRLTIVAVLFAVSQTGSALDYRLSHIFQAAEPMPGDLFGTAVALEDGIAAIKSDSGFVDGNNVSVTHIFEQQPNGGWNEAAILRYDNMEDTSQRLIGNPFNGEELAIDQGTVVIGYGAYFSTDERTPIQFATNESGVWVVRENSFVKISEENRADFATQSSRASGRTVDVSGSFAIATDSGASARNGTFGTARVYARGGDGFWVENDNLLLDEYVTPTSAAIEGSFAAVVDRGSNLQNHLAKVIFFQQSETGSWIETDRFESPDGSPAFWIASVELSGQTAVVRDDSNVLIYDQDAEGGWMNTANLDVGRPRSWPSVAFDEDLIAYQVNIQATSEQYVEVRRRTDASSWPVVATIPKPEDLDSDCFGCSLALDQGRLLIGNSRPGEFGVGPVGSAYLYVPVPEPASIVLLAIGSVFPQRRRN